MKGNQVFVNTDEIVEIIVFGDQTVASVQGMGRQATSLCLEQGAAAKPRLILDNILQIGTVPPAARQAVVELIKSSDYDKLAMLGKGSLLKLGANLLLQATGKGSKVKYFDDRKKAVIWLRA